MNISTIRKFLFFSLIASIATFFSAYAQVEISPPVNGRNISNDLSSVAGAPASAYTTLNDIVISETTPGDFVAGTNLTVTFDAPTGWRFSTAAGSATGVAVGVGSNISSVSIIGKATNRITVGYTITGLTNGANSITISNIQVQSTSAVVLDERFIFRQGGTGDIVGLTVGKEVAPLSKVAGAFKFLQVLLPGQANAPGTTTGKSGVTIVTPIAGTTIPVIVNAVDFGYNKVLTETGDVISLTQNNPHSITPASKALLAGTASFDLVMKTYSPTTTTYYTVTATDDNDGGISPNTSANIRVLAAPFEKLLALFPGETYNPGSLTGKTEPTTITAPVVGVNYPVIVYSVDAFWNRITSTDNISIVTDATNFTAPNAANLRGGTRTFNLLFKVAGETPTAVANDNTNNTITSYSQLLPAVQLGAFSKFQVLLPGETAAPGTTSGKTIVPTALTAGVPFNVTVNAVDASWNILPANTDEITIANVNGAFDATSVFTPSTKELENGTSTFSVTLNTAAINHQVRATAIGGTANSATFTVSPGAFSKLLTILPGESYLPGTTVGKSGTINSVAANANLTVTVRAVDTYSNTVPVTDNVQLTTTDENGTFTSNDLPLMNGVRNFTARLRTAGANPTITVKNAPDSKMDTTEPIEVTTGGFTKLVLILPGENDVQGIAAGKDGFPVAQVAGLPFNVKVKASDAYGNTVKSVGDVVAFTATNDIYADLPANMPLVDGELLTTATYRIGNATNNRRLTVADFTDNTKTSSVSPQFTVNVGNYAGLLAILPGETYAPGSEFGKLNSSSDQMPNAPFNLTVRAVDVAWNTVTTVTDEVSITSSDAEATLPANASLVGGVKTNFSVTLRNNGAFTAASVSQPSKLSNTTEEVSVVVGSFVRLQLLLPGETAAPGTASGKTGTPTPRTAGVPFNVIVNAVDARWNIVNVSDVVAINNVNATYDDYSTLAPNTALSSGSATLSVTQDRAATNHQLRATHVSASPKTASTSPSYTVAPGLYTRLLITLPGETYVPGTASGKTGSIDPVAVNANLTVNVRAVDAFSNTVTSVTDVVNLTTTDVNGVFLTNNLALSSGTRNFIARLTTVGTTTTIKVADVPETKSYTTASITVNAGTFSKFVVILPGESDVQGTVAGKSGTPIAQAAGVTFNVTVKATDAYGNTITSINDAVSFTATNDPYAIFPTLPVDMTLTNGVLSAAVQYRIGNANNNRRLNVSKVGDNTKTGSSSLFTVNVGAYAGLLIVLPGETYTAGAPNGKLNLPNSQTANVSFNVTVRAVDAAWNMISSVNDEVKLTSNVTATLPAANPVLVNGVRTNVAVALSQTGKLTVENITTPVITSYTTEDINITIGTFVKLQLLLPGETAAPGTASGKTGSPTPRTAGVQFNVTVNAVDANWNIVEGVTDVVAISNVNSVFDGFSVLEASKALSSGTATFTVTEKRAATNHQLRATDVTTPAIVVSTTPTFTVTPSTYTRLLIVLPGETYDPGVLAGKSGTITPIAANANLTVNVRAVDAFSNTVPSVTDIVKLTTTDANGIFTSNNVALVGGTRNFVARLATAGTATITVKDVPETKTYTTDPITVTVGVFTKLVLILPGESNAEGIVAGKTGAPTARVAGVPFTVIVKASDAYGNTVITANDVIKFTATNDIYAVLPANTPLINGVLTTSATYRIASTANDRRLTASDVTNAARTASQSPRFTVNTGAYAKLLIVLPGEAYAPGAPTGKINTPANQGANVAFNITVRAVDAAWNLINTVSDQIAITSNVGATLPPNGVLVSGVKTNFSVSLPSTGTLTATNVTNGVITSYTTSSVPVFNATAPGHFFRSTVVLGNWNNSSTWESSPNGSTAWQPATISPTNSSSSIVVRNGNTVNITNTLSVDDLLIENGAQVNITGGTLTIFNGGATDDVVVAGVLRTNNRVISLLGTLKFTATGKYQHNFTSSSGVIPAAGWEVGSVVEIVGYTNFAGEVTGTNQNFSDFVWNTPNQNGVASPYLLSGFNARNFTVTSTGTGALNFADAGGSTSITGNYTQTAGNVVANKTSGTQNLSFGGNFTVNAGAFSLGSGIVNLTYNGSSAQSLVNSGPEIEFHNVTFTSGGTKTLTSGAFSLASTATLAIGSSAELNANGKLILRSTALSTGSIATIPANSSISGNVKVERFISGGSKDKFRTFRMFSSPVYTNGNPGNKAYSFADFIDYMFIGGKGGTANGFDATPGNAGAAYIYNAGFKEIENINTSLNIGKGTYIFFKGDRTNEVAKYTAPFVNPEPVTMVFSGLLNQQNVNLTLIPNGNLVGNPYASSIDWNSGGITKTNLKNNILRIWNPASRSYATYDGLVSVPLGVASNIIPSGQGFFVEAAAAGSASLTFNESAKVNAQPSTLLLAAPSDNQLTFNNEILAGNNDFQTLAASHTELRLTLLENSATFKEEAVVVFKAGKYAAFNAAEDAVYFSGGAEQKVFLSTKSSDGSNLVINYMPEVSTSSEVKLNLIGVNAKGVAGNANGNYQLKVTHNGLPTGYVVKLSDNFKGTTALVQNGGVYDFSINNAVPNSFGANRFSVSFDAPITLPVTLSSFTAVKTNEGVIVKWKSETEINHNRFELERAGDDQLYRKLYTANEKGSGSSYAYLDKTPLLGNNYYRLVQVNSDEKSTVTSPIVINYKDGVGNSLVNVYPNPVKEQFKLQFSGALKGSQYTVKITNLTGQILLNQSINGTALLDGDSLNITNYAAGLYMVEIFENGKQKVAQTKLIKE